MILVNRNFGNPALSQAIGDMFKPTTDDGEIIDSIRTTNTLATNSTLVSTLVSQLNTIGGSTFYDSIKQAATASSANDMWKTIEYNPKNIYIVTEQFLKVLDKVYTKLWNESFTETGIYDTKNLITIFKGFCSDYSKGADSTFDVPQTLNLDILVIKNSLVNFMLFKKFVDRCITAGVLDELDRLDYQDQISLSDLSKVNLSTQVDLANKLITITSSKPVDITPDIDTRTGTYLNGKKLYLMMTPYLPNYYTSMGSTTLNSSEPVESLVGFGHTNTTLINAAYKTAVKRPLAFFKPKTPTSKFGRSLPMATHFFWRIGTPEQKEIAILEGTEVPEIIFDHLDRISHIDSFVLKVKFDKLQF